MNEPLSEAEGCALLTRLFEARGYKMARDVPFQEYGVAFDIDGWDAKARVGFEYLSSEAEDHDDLTLHEYEVLTMAQRRGELFLFIIDETEPLSAAGLAEAANAFLDDVADARARAAALRPTATRPVPSSAAAAPTTIPSPAPSAPSAPAKKAKPAEKAKPAKKAKPTKKAKPAKKAKPTKKAKPAKKLKPAKKAKPAKKRR